MRTILLLLYLFVSSISYAQDHLLPASGFSSHSTLSYRGLLPKLTKGFSENPIAQYIVIPSFSPEYAFSLEKSHRNKYKLKRHRCLENHWYAKEKKKVEIAKSTIFISKKYATPIQHLFETVTNQIKAPEPKSVMLIPLDGTIYYFSYTNTNGIVLTGKTWSPRPNSSMNELVYICDNLMKLTFEEDIKTENIISEIEALTQTLNKKENGNNN